MHMDRVLKQGREYVEDVITHVRTCLWPDLSKHPNNLPKGGPQPEEKTSTCQPERAEPQGLQQNGFTGTQKEDEDMNDVPTDA